MKWIGGSQLHYILCLTNAPSPLLFTCISQRDATRKHNKIESEMLSDQTTWRACTLTGQAGVLVNKVTI